MSRLDAQLLLERYPDCGNLLLRPSGDGGHDVSVTTRQTFNGCACAASGREAGRAWGRSQSWDAGWGKALEAGPELLEREVLRRSRLWDAGGSPCLGAGLETKQGGGSPSGKELDSGAGTDSRRGQTFALRSAGSGPLERGRNQIQGR